MDVTQILKQFNIDPVKAQQAWATAKEMGAGVQTKEQAMKLLADKGIDNQALQKIGTYINSPMANIVASMAGVNIDKVRTDFNALLGGSSQNKTTPVDRLSKYKNGLRQL